MLREGGARLVQYALVLWIALTLNFALPRLAPGDPLDYLFGQEVNTLTEAQKQQVLRELRLDRPVLEQYVGYFTGIVQGDFGRSVRYRAPVAEVLADRVRWTLLLIVPALILKAVIGTVLGAVAAWRRGSGQDLGLLTAMLSLDSMPAFWTGMILISVFAVQLGWLPSFGAMPLGASSDPATLALEIGRRLILPVTTITLATVGAVFLLARASMLTTLGEDYVMMAQAKGLPERTVLLRHVLRNALLPVYTSLTLSLGVLASGAVVVETVFSYPGLGRVIYEGVLARDYPLLQGAFLLVTVGVVAANLLADLTYPLLDPRVRHAGAA
ncbi:MAG: ABC transporter permease [Chloroflexi bacterium]|nr:ABC transporter permease [Chloroflexota bacterium]